MENKDNLLGVLETLYRRRKILLWVCGSVFVGSIIISLLLPVYYQATTLFYAASPDLSNPDKMFGGGNTDMRYYGTGEDVDRLLTIAEGGELVNFLVDTFHLYAHYGIDSTAPKAPFKVREHFFDLYEVIKTKYDAIELSVEDENRVLSAAIANAARQKIENIALRLIKESQKQQMQTYRDNIAESEKILHVLGDSLAAIRARYSIFNPETQGEILASKLISTESKVSSLEGKLSSLEANARTPRDTILLVKANLVGAQNQLERLTENVNKFNEGSSRVSMLSDQHEKARFQLSWDKERLKHLEAAYASTPPVIHLVEVAEVPVVKSRPIRSIVVLASTFAAFLFTVIGLLIFDQYKDVNWQQVMREESGNGKPEHRKKAGTV